MAPVADWEHLLKSYDIADLVDEVASAEPPAYLRRCFAEAASAPRLSWARVQQLAGCALLLDAVADGRDYPGLEPELIADWRTHYAQPFAGLKELAVRALRHAAGAAEGAPPEALAELQQLAARLAAA